MRTFKTLLFAAIILFPMSTLAVSDNGNGSSDNNLAVSSNGGTSSNGNTTQVQTQTQTNNSGTGTMIQTQTQTQEELNLQVKIQESQPSYQPKNAIALEHRSVVAVAAEYLIRVAERTENKGIGDQIRIIAQTQSENQDKIGQSIDKAETRTRFAEFFIGPNYKELKIAKQAMERNREQIRELEKNMAALTVEADKLQIANQIIALQNDQLELREQLSDMTSGFSFFGWLNRWINKY